MCVPYHYDPQTPTTVPVSSSPLLSVLPPPPVYAWYDIRTLVGAAFWMVAVLGVATGSVTAVALTLHRRRADALLVRRVGMKAAIALTARRSRWPSWRRGKAKDPSVGNPLVTAAGAPVKPPPARFTRSGSVVITADGLRVPVGVMRMGSGGKWVVPRPPRTIPASLTAGGGTASGSGRGRGGFGDMAKEAAVDARLAAQLSLRMYRSPGAVPPGVAISSSTAASGAPVMHLSALASVASARSVYARRKGSSRTSEER